MPVKPVFQYRSFSYEPTLCFILMPFALPWSVRIWKKIRASVTKCGFTAKRADDMFGQNVMEDIWCAINRSSVIIADVTDRNPNDFYELGIAHTVGKRVVIITQDEESVPFDIRPYRYIIYEDNADGYEALEKGLCSTLREIQNDSTT